MKEIVYFLTDLFIATFGKCNNLRGKYVFIWIPKNAGTSIYASLRKNGMIKYKRLIAIKYLLKANASLTFGHISLDSLFEGGLVKERDVSDSHFFAVLRDPYERFSSIYNYYQSTGAFRRYHLSPSVSEVLDMLEKGHYPKVGLYHHVTFSMFNPQSSWIPKDRKVTFFRQDKLQEDINRYFSDLGENVTIRIDRLNSNVVEIDLSQDERKRIKALYRIDFELIESVNQGDIST